LDIVTAESITHSDHYLMTSFASTTFSYTFSITNIYAPSKHHDTRAFLEEF
jgi:hypothetical protein